MVIVWRIAMDLELDTFLTTVYCVVDDLWQAEFARHKPVRPGPRPELADSEVLTLMLLAQWHPRRSERAFVRYAARHWRGYFPRLLSQSAFNRRARDLGGVLGQLGPALARRVEQIGGPGAYEVLDGVPVPLMRRCRGERHRLFGEEAGLGCGGSDREWYYGVQLLASGSPHGVLTGWLVGPANTEERWVAEAFFRWRRAPSAPAPTVAQLEPLLGRNHHPGGWVGPTGPLAPYLAVGAPAPGPYLADMGFAGARWGRHWWQHYGAAVLTKAAYRALPTPAERYRAAHWLSSLRQVTETAFQWLTETFGLKYPRARTYWGLLTRLGAKVAAFNVAVHINILFARPRFAGFNPLEA
jgi:hypothetical protein